MKETNVIGIGNFSTRFLPTSFFFLFALFFCAHGCTHEFKFPSIPSICMQSICPRVVYIREHRISHGTFSPIHQMSDASVSIRLKKRSSFYFFFIFCAASHSTLIDAICLQLLERWNVAFLPFCLYILYDPAEEKKRKKWIQVPYNKHVRHPGAVICLAFSWCTRCTMCMGGKKCYMYIFPLFYDVVCGRKKINSYLPVKKTLLVYSEMGDEGQHIGLIKKCYYVYGLVVESTFSLFDNTVWWIPHK